MCNPFDRCNSDELTEILERCCASTKWIEAMKVRRPFSKEQDLVQTASDVWWSLEESDWREAFEGHPRIGDVDSLRAKYANTSDLASGEQAGVNSASEATLKELAAANAAYEARFGYLFIVCATGKTAGEMLAILKERLGNQPSDEIRIAAAEQLAITQIRLGKLHV